METEILLEEYRGGVLECRHSGAVCVVDENGIAAYAGGSRWVCYYRSAAKPLQALPVLMRGLHRKFGLSDEETGIFSGSHRGDEEHMRVMESILRKTGLREDQMIMRPAYPGRESRMQALLREGGLPRKLYHNCAGKHLGMMLLARELGDPVEDYWRRDSKTQREILAVISRLSGIQAEDIRVGIDGCGVPVYAVPFYAIAESYLNMARPERIADGELRAAVEENTRILHSAPNMLAGEGFTCSILTADPDIVAKGGALGVYAFGIRSLGVGVVAKIADGSQYEAAFMVSAVCEQLGYENAAIRRLREEYPQRIINDNAEEVGLRRAVFKLKRA